MRQLIMFAFPALALMVTSGVASGASTWPADFTRASNQGGIVNTRHNMTQSYLKGASISMDGSRNDYGEVCVYCHTPHGSNTQMGAAPLWNRTKPTSTFTVYGDGQTSSGQAVSAPGSPSLTCLSCHDGVTAIDSVINMPGSGGYNAAQMTSVDLQWLQTWPGAGPNIPPSSGSASLRGCYDGCHSDRPNDIAPDFAAFIMGTDLRDDHPVGVQRPNDDANYNKPTPVGSLAFFDKNGNGRSDSNEIRFYNTGQGFEVECASCHDPHGVPSAGQGSQFIKSFLRVNNSAQSAVCLTCHIK